MARHERDIRASARAQLDSDEMLAILGDPGALADRDRQEAIACYLSGSEGWHEAGHRLGGTFSTAATRLRPRKGD
ncbi:hypothetical protein [Sphingomonas sp.]|uniref:hypothetical protein n=1 Tax=Sphingomonas sp. TaxID=28214 RepID=UPI0025F0F080|nr:hypothetical protein [Sphingomonas sp.]MBV9528222.1 hypothetical protein [Sphingomonas sp.]